MSQIEVTLVLEVPINLLHILQVHQRKIDQIVRLLVEIVGNHQRTVESVVAE